MKPNKLATKTFVPFAQVREHIKSIVSKHKGMANAISSTELFKQTYGVYSEDITNIERKILMSARLTNVLKSLRGLDVFVCNIKDERNGYIFYIPVSTNDYKMYKQYNQIKINNINEKTKQCKRFVETKKYLQIK